MIWNYSICVRHSGYELYMRVYNCDTWWEKSPFFISDQIPESRIPLSPTYWTFKRAWPDQGSSDGFVYLYFLSFKGLQNGQTLTRRCNSGGRFCGCAIQPPCGRGNILRVKWCVEFKICLRQVSGSCHKYLWDKNWIIVCAWVTETCWESWAHSDFSTLGISPLRDPARKNEQKLCSSRLSCTAEHYFTK